MPPWTHRKVSRISSPLFSAPTGQDTPQTLEMAQEILDQTLSISDDHRIVIDSSPSSDHRSSSSSESVDPSLSRNSSSSSLNAGAPEFVPRAPPPSIHASNRVDAHHPRPVKIQHDPPPPPPAVHHVFHVPLPSPQFVNPPSIHGSEYFGSGFREPEGAQAPAEPDPAPSAAERLSDEITRKITKQVEYYFSNANLATTEHLMRFISKDPDGYVPIPVIASFKKIKALVYNNSLLADALRTSSKLVVSDDGRKVRRQQPFTESDAVELQSRIIVAENLPEDHCYQNLMKVFSVVGRVKTIRTCYPQTPNGTAAATNKSTKMDMIFGNKVHAFVEYETVDDAERAVAELNDERNWRSGLRVRLLLGCMTKHGMGRGRKTGHEGDGNGEDDDLYTNNHPSEDPSQSSEAFEHLGEEGLNDKEGGVARRGRGRGRGGRGRGRGQYHSNSHRSGGGGHAVGTPPSSHPIHTEQPAVVYKQPPGPRTPDGTRGFTLGRGKPLASATTS